MAVFTQISRAQLEAWLTSFSLGQLVDVQGISAGIENSNYFVTLRAPDAPPQSYVLTLFERLSADQLPFYLELMRYLAQRGIPCPAPLVNRQGALFSLLNQKPASLITRLPGRALEHPDALHCAAIGHALAQLHLAGQNFPLRQANLRGLAWWKNTAAKLSPFLTQLQQDLLKSEISFQSEFYPATAAQLPKGPIHADLFRDNALFVDDRLGGIIDFYFAGCDAWLLDVAICVNDWCINWESGDLEAQRTQALLAAYAALRPFSPGESAAWQMMLRAAALRFWLSRLADFHQPRPAQLLVPHDPAHFERILCARQSARSELPGVVE